MKKYEYMIVRSENSEKLIYHGWHTYTAFKKTWKVADKYETILICKPGTIKKEWIEMCGIHEYEVAEKDIIKKVER